MKCRTVGASLPLLALALVGCSAEPEAVEAEPAKTVAKQRPAPDLAAEYGACSGYLQAKDTYLGTRTLGVKFLELADEDRTVIVEPNDYFGSFNAGWCVLEQAEAPRSVLSKIENTRESYGRTSDTWVDGDREYEVTWSLPEAGLDMVLEVAAVGP